MRAVIQRVQSASVCVDNKIVGEIERGLLVLLGVGADDTNQDLAYLVNKTAGLRIFEDQTGHMNLSLSDVGGSVLAVSQFTLYGDVRRGKRPSFTTAAPPELALRFYQQYVEDLRATGLRVEQGVFQADMQVALINDGPVTIMLDSRKLF